MDLVAEYLEQPHILSLWLDIYHHCAQKRRSVICLFSFHDSQRHFRSTMLSTNLINVHTLYFIFCEDLPRPNKDFLFCGIQTTWYHVYLNLPLQCKCTLQFKNWKTDAKWIHTGWQQNSLPVHDFYMHPALSRLFIHNMFSENDGKLQLVSSNYTSLAHSFLVVIFNDLYLFYFWVFVVVKYIFILFYLFTLISWKEIMINCNKGVSLLSGLLFYSV